MEYNKGLLDYNVSDIADNSIKVDDSIIKIITDLRAPHSCFQEKKVTQEFARNIKNTGAQFYLDREVREGDKNCVEAFLMFNEYLAVCRISYASNWSNSWSDDWTPHECLIIPYINIESIKLSADENSLNYNLLVDFGRDRTVEFGLGDADKNEYVLDSTTASRIVYINYKLGDVQHGSLGTLDREKYNAHIVYAINCVARNKVSKEKRVSGIFSLFGLSKIAVDIVNNIADDNYTATTIIDNKDLIFDNDANKEVLSIINTISLQESNSSKQELSNTISLKEEELTLLINRIEELLIITKEKGMFGARKERKELDDLKAKRIAKQKECDKAVLDFENFNPFESLFQAIDRISDDTGILKRSSIVPVYRECKSKGIQTIDSIENEMLFKTVCKKYNIPSFAITKDLFLIGELLDEKYQLVIRAEKGEEIRKKRIDSNNVKKKLAELVGKEKYMIPLDEGIKSAESALQVLENIRVLGQKMQITSPSKSSWAIAGGAASAIAGPGVGAAVALEKMNERNRIEQLNMTTIADNTKLNSETAGKKAPYLEKIRRLKDRIGELENKLCDTDHTDVFSSYYSFYIDSQKINEDGTVDLVIKAKKEKPFIFGSLEIDVDGSMHIEALDEGVVVGEGFLIGDGYQMEDSHRGFGEDIGYDVNIVPLETTYSFKNLENIEFQITPINIWMIEK